MTAAPSWAARCGSSKHCFKYLFCTLWWNFILQRLLHGADTLLPQGLFPACFCGWAGAAGWPDGTRGAGHCGQLPALFYLGTVLRRTTRESIPAYQRGIFAAAAFAVLLILGQLGSVGLAGNGYSSPIFLLVTSLAGWMPVAAHWRACP